MDDGLIGCATGGTWDEASAGGAGVLGAGAWSPQDLSAAAVWYLQRGRRFL